jgi:chromosomal replication initiation ATPase DnaA
MTNKRYKKISIPLITNFKFLSEKSKIMQTFFQINNIFIHNLQRFPFYFSFSYWWLILIFQI